MAYGSGSLAIKASIGGSLPAALNTWHVVFPGGSYDTTAVNGVITAIAAFYTSIADRIPSGTTISVGSQVIELGNTPPTTVTATPVSVNGSATGSVLPYQNTLTLKMRGTGVSRRYRGRVHLPCLMVADSSGGAPTSTLINDVNAAAATLFAAGSTSWGLAINSRLDVAMHPVIQILSNTSYTVLRSRRR